VGRYVRVQKTGSGPLHMAEVEVHGCPEDAGITLMANVNAMFVSPNPSNTSSTVSFDRPEEVEELLIFDMSGRMIQRFDAKEIKRGDHYEMDVYPIPVGTYIVRSRNTSGIELSTQMVIKR